MNTFRPPAGGRPPAGHRWDPDLHRDRDRDRDWDRWGERELFPTSRLSPALPTTKADQDEAVSKVASHFRQLVEEMGDKIKVAYQREIEAKAFERREQDYRKQQAGTQFPAVEELYQKAMSDHRKKDEKLGKELNRSNALLDKLVADLSEALIKSLPVPEIKVRQCADMVLADLAKDKPAKEDRLQKLERQLNATQESQKAHLADFDALKKAYSSLDKKCESHVQEIEALKKENERFTSELVSVKESHAALAKLVDTQQQAQASTATASTDNLRKDLLTLKQRVDIHEQRVNVHETQLSGFDASEHHNAMAKLLFYPVWPALEGRLQELQKDVAGLQTGSQRQQTDLTVHTADVERRFKNYLESSSELLGQCVGGLSNRLKALESPSAAVTLSQASSDNDIASSRVSWNGLDATALQNEINRLQQELEVLRDDFTQTSTAQEIMITTLDDQFKNMTTTEIAQIILEHLKRLPNIPVESQSFHQRISTLEDYQKRSCKTDDLMRNWALNETQDVYKTKRMLAEENRQEQLAKRVRVNMEHWNGLTNTG